MSSVADPTYTIMFKNMGSMEHGPTKTVYTNVVVASSTLEGCMGCEVFMRDMGGSWACRDFYEDGYGGSDEYEYKFCLFSSLIRFCLLLCDERARDYGLVRQVGERSAL